MIAVIAYRSTSSTVLLAPWPASLPNLQTQGIRLLFLPLIKQLTEQLSRIEARGFIVQGISIRKAPLLGLLGGLRAGLFCFFFNLVLFFLNLVLFFFNLADQGAKLLSEPEMDVT